MNVRRSLWVGILAVGLPVIAEATGPADFVQAAYQWRNDNGSESGATWKAAVNTAIVAVKRDENIRLRFAVKNVAIGGAQNGLLNGRVEYAEGSINGPWIPVAVDPGSQAFRMSATAWYTNGEPTTAKLTLSGYTFTPGKCVEEPANRAEVTIPPNALKYSNVEYCFQATAYAKRNTTYYFRVGQLLNPNQIADYFTYTQVAVLTMENTDGVLPTDNIYVDDADLNTLRIGDALWLGLLIDDQTDTHYLPSWLASAETEQGAWQGGSSYNVMAIETNIVAFRWIPNVLTAADYRVYVRWTYASNRGRNIPYRVHHAGGTSAEMFFNQRDPALATNWNLLGTYTFNTGTNGYVEMGGNDGFACADAIWLERVGAAPVDGDADGMPDSWENTYLGGTNASPTADADLDGMSNLEEFLAGTNPTDAASVLRITQSEILSPPFDPAQGSQQSEILIRWLSVDGKTYEILKSTNLLSGFTVTEATNIAAVPPTNSYPVTLGTSGSAFYRVSVE